jgi:hypothetical protein
MKKKPTSPTENWVMVATVGMLFTAMSTALAVFIASGALDGVDGASVQGLWGAAIALASLCLLMAVAGVAIFVMRTEGLKKGRKRKHRTMTGRPQAT